MGSRGPYSGRSYSIPDPRRGSLTVGLGLFAADQTEYYAMANAVQKHPEYVACLREGSEIKKRRSMCVDEYRAILQETKAAPPEIKMLKKAREVYANALDLEQDLREQFEKGITSYNEEMRILELRLSGCDDDQPQKKAIIAEITEKKEAFRLLKRRCSERESRINMRKERNLSAITSLSQLKDDLLKQKQAEIKSLDSEIARLKKRLRRVVKRVAGNVLDVPDQVISLIQKDPDIGDETARQILALVPNYRKAVWNICCRDPRCGSIAIIASCIEENPAQTMAELIIRVADCRNCQFADAMVTLCSLRAQGRLCRFRTYSDGSVDMVRWPQVCRGTHSGSNSIASSVVC